MLVALFLTLQAAAPPPTAKAQEVVVTARRLKDWRGNASANAKGSRCKTVRSTGDRELDQIACDSLRYCMAQAGPEMQAATKTKGAEQQRRIEQVNRQLEACGNEQQQLRVADLLERRWAQRAAAEARR